MAESPSNTASDEAASGPIFSFDTDSDPEPSPSTETGGDEPAARARRTWVGVAVALAVSLATILLARSIVVEAGVEIDLAETVLVGLVGLAVALAAFVPLRWGFWVVAFVAGAHYALNFYNMLFTDSSIYQFVETDAMGYAMLSPAIGVVLGWLLQGVHGLVTE